MDNLLLRKLCAYTHVPDADRQRLIEAMSPVRQYASRTDIVEEGDDPRAVNVILDGWACSYKQLTDGRRQIVSLMLPGDPCDPQVFRLDRRDNAIRAITTVTLTTIRGRAMRDLTKRSPALEDAFYREMQATASICRERIVSLGRRDATERLAHLLCELHARLAAVGLADGLSCPMPLTQADLADALGQTSVHINRTLRELRGKGLVTLKGRRLTIHDLDGLSRLALFDPAYLHIRM